MITYYNLPSLLETLNDKQLNRIRKSRKEYVALFLHTFNVGAFLTFVLTDNYDRYKNLYKNGNCLICNYELTTFIDTILINRREGAKNE